MKKKRIILHICILLLAVVCMVTGMYIFYVEENSVYYNYAESYNFDYVCDVENIFDYGYVQSEFRKKYADDKKVLIENKELGNVTVKDIKEIFSDKYSNYINNDDGEFADYYDYYEYYGYDNDYYYENEDGNLDELPQTLYGIDILRMKKYEADWKKNPTDSNMKKYKYYQNKCKYVDEYADMALELTQGIRDDNGDSGAYSDYDFLVNATYPEVKSGMKYYIQYTIDGNLYIISNVGSTVTFQNSSIVDKTVLKDGVMMQEEAPYGVREFENSWETTEFLKQVKKGYVGISANEINTHYYNYMENIKEQQPKKEQQRMSQYLPYCFIVLIVTLVIALIIYIILMIMAGHDEKGDSPHLCNSDRLWWDLEFAVAAAIYAFVLLILYYNVNDEGYHKIFAICVCVFTLPAIEYFVLGSESLMRRLKTKSFMQTTLWGKIWKMIKTVVKKIKRAFRNLLDNMSLAWKVAVSGVLIFVWQICIEYISDEISVTIAILGAFVVTLAICYLIWCYFSEVGKVAEGAGKISDGALDYKINDNMKFGVNRVMKDCVNNIGEGLSAAVEESIKNERMKTELITNVSHDLKTPLTSIINYIDLLKTDGLESEKAGKYLGVLEQKSQRLKHLTEDLIEASKLNSGVAELEKEKIDIVQLVNQSIAEYDEKFERKNLQVVKTIQEEPLYVMADGRKTWRLFDNLYNNIFKYAMSGTRVYIDIKAENAKTIISLKNISETPLNFGADELMERFVRGDISRTTEGSGLGLSIAKSIVERQDGKMNITLDGDLFKVEIFMNLIS